MLFLEFSISSNKRLFLVSEKMRFMVHRDIFNTPLYSVYFIL
nr:MAG TPA: hypothetical protein [Caudoviricetes sp.]